mmetsp:Transcript_2393/g.4432  ORF Transcript_2393/g.4432 Transcript_2393/m.4432 type:complete len:688 (-) Transcript_2393:53-2116(-)
MSSTKPAVNSYELAKTGETKPNQSSVLGAEAPMTDLESNATGRRNEATHDEDGNAYGGAACLWDTGGKSVFASFWSWLVVNKNQLLSGVTVSLAQVPEAVAFSLVAGVKPIVGLHAAWIMGFFTAVVGGRPGMISGATGAVAVVMIDLVADYGVEYLFYAVMLAGIIQASFGALGGGALVRMIPHPVMVGFVNGLGIVIGLAQFNSFKVQDSSSDDGHRRLEHRRLGGGAFAPFTDGEEWVSGTTAIWMAVHVLVAMFVTVMLPRISKAFPSALAGILTPTIVEWAIVRPIGHKTNVIEDVSSVAGSFPIPVWFDSQYNMPSLSFDLIGKIWVTSVLIACIGMLESLMTLSLIDDMTATKGNRNQECIGQGTGNIISGIFGAMGGCTTIGQSIMNIHNGGTTRLSAVSASMFMLLIILVAYPVINLIPTAALVGVMFVICYHTIEWSSINVIISTSMPRKWRTDDKFKLAGEKKVNRSDALTVLIVMAVTLIMDLAVAVVVGIVFSSLMFAWNSGSTLTVERTLAADKKSVTYEVGGSLFFASIMPFMEKFSVRDDPDNVHIHFDNCDIYDWSAIEAVNSLAEKYAEEDKKVKFGKISLSSRRIMEKAKQLLKGEVADSFSIINEEEIVPGEANKIGEGFIGGRKPTWAERGGDTTKRRKGGSEADEELGLKEEPKPEPEKKFFGLF